VLITFPLGLLPIAVVFDLMAWISGTTLWAELAFYLMAAGTLGGMLAAVFGLIDWLAIPHGTRARAIGAWHGLGNVLVVSLFALSWTLRAMYSPGPVSRLLALIGLGLALVTGWLGGELVTRLGVGIDPGAHLNAPNSLSGEPAEATARPRSPRS
jgi:uncharacterized membrane protein